MAKRSSSSGGSGNVKRRAWVPQQIETTIGENDYILEAVPISQVQHFEDMLSHIGQDVLGLTDRYYVVNGSGAREGPFSHEEAQAQLDDRGDDAELDSDDFDLKTVLLALAQVPYHLLKIMIPDLIEEDCEKLTYPQLMFLVDILVELNGLDWFKAVVKNLSGPLLQELGNAAADLLRTVSLRSSLETAKSTATELTE